MINEQFGATVFEPRHDKTNKMAVRPAKTQISLGIRPVWSESSLCAQWVAKDLSFLHADSKDSDQTGRMPRLIWVFDGRTVILLVLSCHGSFHDDYEGWRAMKHSVSLERILPPANPSNSKLEAQIPGPKDNSVRGKDGTFSQADYQPNSQHTCIYWSDFLCHQNAFKNDV